MLLIPMFFYINPFLEKYKTELWLKSIFTFIQIFSPIFIYFVMLKYNFILLRCYFVLILCLFIFIISYDFGFLSRLLSHKLCVKIMSCQMEMYLSQYTINNIFYNIIKRKKFESIFNKEIQFLIKLFIIFICGYLYKILIKEKFSQFLDKLLFLFKKIILD